MREIFDNPRQLIENLTDEKAYFEENIYLIKVKCICCSESNFIPYKEPIIDNEMLRIGENSYPLDLIEKVVFRRKTAFGTKTEYEYKVSSNYLKQFLNNEAREILSKLKLL